jgi:hypothetical protein
MRGGLRGVISLPGEASVPPFSQGAAMKIADLIAPITELARPFTIYASGLAVAVGAFVPSVSADKLWVAAAVAGSVSVARSIDKRVTTKFGPAVPFQNPGAGQ